MSPNRRKNESSLAGYSPPLLKPRSTLRWVVFVGLNLAGFAATCVFWQYVRTGTWFDFHPAAFRRDLTVPLGQILLEPLSIFTHPWMILVAGLLLTVLIATPLAVAVMYPLLLSMLFVVMVAVLAHAPWLALALAAGCLLAARSRLRREYPYFSALLGFLPVGVYLYLLTYVGIDATLLLPLQRWILAVPFALSTLLFVSVFGLVIWLSRLLRFQPGVVWPTLLLLPAAAGLFYWQIGPAELHYALLVKPLATGTALLPSLPQDEWRRRQGQGLNQRILHTRIDDDLQRQRRELQTKCESFLRRYPRSRRAPAVAWLFAQAESLQRDQRAPGSELIRYTSSWPMANSAEAWQRLVETYPASPQAALAKWRLGVLTLRNTAGLQGDEALAHVARADKSLRDTRDQLRTIVMRLRENEPVRRAGIFTDLPSLPRQSVYERALFDAEVLTWQIAQNDVVNTPLCAQALARLLAINPCEPEYARHVKRLAQTPTFAKTKMSDNLRMAVAKLHADPYDHAEAMIPLAKDQRTDTAIEAHYELGRITRQTAQARAISLTEGIQSPETYFKIVVAAPPNPWQRQALENLRWLQSTNLDRSEP